MRAARWYATADHTAQRRDLHPGRQEGGERHPEIGRRAGSFRALTGMTRPASMVVPAQLGGPDGRIFGYSYRKMYYVDPKGIGTITVAGAMPANGPRA